MIRANTCGEYGEPSLNNLGRFAYTGQIILPELAMYYYKARIYSFALGRFLQTDPIGYEDRMNLYAYVHNDPMNLIDPTGREIGDRFDTPEEAAIDAVESINPTSIEENTEYGGTIEREVTTGENADGTTSEQVQYFATDPDSGDGDEVDISASRSSAVGDYHTHGDYSKVGPNGDPVDCPCRRDFEVCCRANISSTFACKVGQTAA